MTPTAETARDMAKRSTWHRGSGKLVCTSPNGNLCAVWYPRPTSIDPEAGTVIVQHWMSGDTSEHLGECRDDFGFGDLVAFIEKVRVRRGLPTAAVRS